MRALYLNDGYIALVDECDWPLVRDKTWTAVKDDKAHTPYAITWLQIYSGFRKRLPMHRLIMEVEDDEEKIVDHINGFGLDNRRDNLRIVNSHMNSSNRSYHRQGKKRGAYKVGNRWQAKFRGKHLGMYATQEEAWKAYDEEAKKQLGVNVILNFPPS